MPRRRGIALVLLALVLVAAAQPPLALNPGDSIQVTCSTTLSGSIGANSASLTCASPAPGTTILTPVADAYTYSAQPTVNFGTNVALRVDASPVTDSFLRFDTSGLAVTSEVLRVWADTAQATGFTVHSVTGIWTEATIDFANQPALGASIGSSGSVAAGAYYSIPVSGSSFALDTTNSTALRLSSREGAHPPQLVVTTGGTPSPTPSSTASIPSPTPTAPPASPTPQVTPPPTPSPTPTPQSGAIQHVVIVWLENHEASSITASSMPYLFGLGQQYGVSSQFYAVSHPSEPNYLALWSGSTQGVTDDGVYNLGAASLSNQMDTAGLSWRSYQQDYPDNGACNTGATYSGGVDGWGVAGTYARKHNPAMSFTYVSGTLSRCLNVQALVHFDPSVNLAFVVPNLINDAHDGTLAQADSFLQAFLPQVFGSSDWAHTLLVVSFDEGTSSANGGGRIYTAVMRAGLSGFTSATVHNHYGLLRTVEDIFSLPCLGASCSAAPLTEFLSP